jgi:hypothetical protein
MKQTTRTLIGLLALLVAAVAIGGAALWAGKDEERKAEAKEKSEKLFDFDKAHVKSLRLEKGGKLVAALSKDDKGWKIAEPLQAEADEGTVDSLPPPSPRSSRRRISATTRTPRPTASTRPLSRSW